MNATCTLATLRELRGMLYVAERYFLDERGWTCRVNDEGRQVWAKIHNGHGLEVSQADAVKFEEGQ